MEGIIGDLSNKLSKSEPYMKLRKGGKMNQMRLKISVIWPYAKEFKQDITKLERLIESREQKNGAVDQLLAGDDIIEGCGNEVVDRGNSSAKKQKKQSDEAKQGKNLLFTLLILDIKEQRLQF